MKTPAVKCSFLLLSGQQEGACLERGGSRPDPAPPGLSPRRRAECRGSDAQKLLLRVSRWCMAPFRTGHLHRQGGPSPRCTGCSLSPSMWEASGDGPSPGAPSLEFEAPAWTLPRPELLSPARCRLGCPQAVRENRKAGTVPASARRERGCLVFHFIYF